MPVAIHYSSVRTPAKEREVFGLQVAVLDWLRAFFRHGRQEKFSFLIADTAARGEILDTAMQAGLDPSRLMLLDARHARENLAQFDAVFRADLYSHKILWQRQRLAGPGFAFCALAHAISGAEGGELLEQYCLAPTDGADAIVCPSKAVKSAIGAFWNNHSDYLVARFGAKFRCEVQLPVIPLGVDVEALAARAAPAKRSGQRAALGLKDGDIVLLWVGRLSHAIKAHPLAMFRAAERAAELTGASVHLVMQGYFVPQEAGAQFEKLARDVCRKAKVTFVASDDPRFPDGLWAGGDIFLSLVDNMQESFGLTPIEAMAAGMPRVVSDWNGYRDSVTDGEDGYLVPTTLPPPGSGQELAALLLDGREMYGGFLGKTALCAAVDFEAAAQALKTLIEDKNRRQAMAEKARMRARNAYDWRHVIPAYEALWAELAAKRKSNHPPLAGGSTGEAGRGGMQNDFNPSPAKTRSLLRNDKFSLPLPQGEREKGIEWPLVPDPFAMYAAYPSATLEESGRVALAADADTIRLLLGFEINTYGADIMLAGDELAKLLKYFAAQTETSIAAAFAQFPGIDRARLWRTLGWLLKLGILRKA